MKYLVSFRTTLKVSRYLFRALALLLWLLVALFSVFFIVNALHQKEAEIRQSLISAPIRPSATFSAPLTS